MNSIEKRTAISLSTVFACRMLGLFMVLPVMASIGQTLPGATPLLLGFAIGAYGLSQAILQIPFGYLSDRYGRKPIIIVGLLLFALGSVVAAMADTVWGVIIGRFLQGSGAIAGVVMALAADLTRDQERSKVMAIIGSSIGAAFIIAFSLGPLIAQHWQLSGLFLITAFLALVAIVVIQFLTPTPVISSDERRFKFSQLTKVLKEQQLLRLDAAIFCLHFFLTAFFVAVPTLFAQLDFSYAKQSVIYVSAMLISFVIMIPVLIVTEKRRKHRFTMLLAIMLLSLSSVLLLFKGAVSEFLITAIVVFFVAFNILEASLPSLISRIVPGDYKGSALGVYSTAQFLGAFFGGLVGGLMLTHFDQNALFYLCIAVAGLWFVLSLGLDNPPQMLNLTVTIDPAQVDGAISALKAINGIKETVLIADENTVYIKAFEEQFEINDIKRLPFVSTVS